MAAAAAAAAHLHHHLHRHRFPHPAPPPTPPPGHPTPPPQINLTESSSSTLPFENGRQIRALALSPDGRTLLSIDDQGRAVVVNRRRRALLHHVSFKAPVRLARFSPDGAYVAVAVGRLVQVWAAPSLDKSVAPMQLHRTYGHCHADITALDWSADSLWLAAGGKDLTCRVFSMHPIEGYRPPTLAGHREPLVAGEPAQGGGGCCMSLIGLPLVGLAAKERPERNYSPTFFVPTSSPPRSLAVHFTTARLQESAGLIGKEAPHLYTLSRDGALFAWTYRKTPAAVAAGEAATAAPAAAIAGDSSAGRKRRRMAPGGGSDAEGGEEEDDDEQQEEEDGSSSSSDDDDRAQEGEAGAAAAEGRRQLQPVQQPQQSETFTGGTWHLTEKHYFNQRGARLSTADFHGGVGLLAVGFTSGLFELLQLPDLLTLHTLSIGRCANNNMQQRSILCVLCCVHRCSILHTLPGLLSTPATRPYIPAYPPGSG